MQNFLISNIHILLTIFGVSIFLLTIKNWKSIPVLQKMVRIQFFFVILHTWEEMRFPGGFLEMIQNTLSFTLINQSFGELVLTVAILLMFIPAFLFPKIPFLSITAMFLGILEAVAHTVAIWIFDQKIPYTPGLLTAFALLLPVSIYSIHYGIKHHIIKPKDFLLSLVTMFAILLVSQMIVVESTGMNYLDFLLNIKKSLYSQTTQNHI